ncbi:MAG TPA: hypothetical protein VKS79_19335 [Gemmataceae bacterium]|nr:hypothetical protein [Gemmataceae bacterium]
MKTASVCGGIIIGFVLGIAGTAFCLTPAFNPVIHNHLQPQPLQAGSNDRYDDYVMCTGAASIFQRAPTDGVWLLDYRGGKLLGTIIDRSQGKIIGWAEMNLVQEFGIPPKQPVHFMMTTGNIAQGQAALYVAETTTGKFGVYTLGTDPTGQQQGLVIRRHDMTTFRKGPG